MTRPMKPRVSREARPSDTSIDHGAADRSLNDAVAAAQAIMAKVATPDRVLSEELIADRRAQAARD